jgi:AcrR family transcriptional regulator
MQVQRKQKDKQEMRQSILEEARVLFLLKGYEHTSMRNIAEKLGCSPGTIYLYFQDKDALFHALHQEGFRKLTGMMEPLRFVENPFERLKALCRVYMDFAMKNKDLYDLMFILQAPMNILEHKECWDEGQKALSFLKEVLADCQLAGWFKGMNLEPLSFIIWSAMHGMCALYCRERCQAYEGRDPLELMNEGYVLFATMLEKFERN